jgi:hypothetical protein
VARESTFLCFATGSDSPRGLAFGPDGYLYSKVLPPAVAIDPYGAAKCEPSRGQEYDSRGSMN